MIRKIFPLLFVVLILSANNSYAQEDVKINKSEFKLKKKGTGDALKNIKYGDYYYEQHTQGSYLKALNYYLEAFEYNPDNAELNYKIGVCYLESIFGAKSLSFLQASYNAKSNVASDVEFYLGMALQLNYKFDEAISLFKKYLPKISADAYKTSVVNKKIYECQNGKILNEKQQRLIITNMNVLNSSSKEYGSLITADGSKMYFSSRRPNKTGDIDLKDDQYFEDIYVSEKDSSSWGVVKNLKSLNTAGHDDAVGLSHDGNTLILYYSGDLFFSELNGDQWSNPKPFPKTINSKEIESSACFSLDGQTLYFVRGKDPDPMKSNGDIYFSKKDEKGEWGVAAKLPDNINTPYDEDGLFMFADGQTIYFSSKGHNSMGGYDIFKTTINDDRTFSDPENMGAPLNTPSNDIYFVMESNNTIGYLTTIRDDTYGFTDIYQVRFTGRNMFMNSEDNLIASIANPITEVNLEKKVVVIITGKIIDQQTGLPIDAEIVIIDNNTNQVIYSTKSNSQNGEYSVNVPVGKNYGMVIRKDGYLFQSENFDLVSTSNYEEISKNIELSSIEVNSIARLSNIFFDFASSNLKDASVPELDRVVQFMKDNPNMKIEISGHTDNIGNYDDNMRLSQQRAEAVAQYISNKGIPKERIIAKGYGFEKPVATNNTPEGRQQNRRVEFKVTSFK
ncbi:MAG: OmpA family protein [Bacteroidales bacterium]|nr:OmpA family protein [Bacteroidales bacterium]